MGKTDKQRQDVYVGAAFDVMSPVIEAIRPLHTNKVWDDISPQFLTTFWSLTMYDLFVPDNVYEKEIAKLKAAPAGIDENKELNLSRKKKEKERVNNLMEKLIDEQKRQREHVEKVKARLRAEKDSWFLSRSAKLAKNETITTFLQLFLFPRCIFTASDAIYCAKFVEEIHSLKTPNFSTLICFDRIFCDITYTVTSCTENEAHRYGRFLCAMLEIVMRWWRSGDIFEKECVGYPGFVTKFRTQTDNKEDNAKNSKDHVDYENYRHVVHKWHFKIAKALVVCLESKDYVQIRNALTILTKILPHFPVIAKLNGVVEKRIEKVCADEKESRKDLYIKAMSYSGQLKARKHLVMKEYEFHQVALNKADADKNEVDTPALPAPKKASKSVEKVADTSTSRSQSREKSLSRGDRETSEDRKARKERESKSRDRSLATNKEKRRDDDRHGSKDRGGMGPPQSATSHRRSVEPADDKDSSKKRKGDSNSSNDEPGSEKRSKREKSEPVSSPTSTSSQQGKRDKKSERKRDREDIEVIYDEKRKRGDSDHEDSRKSAQNGDADRKNRASSTKRTESKRK